jgi:hypothetical protein
MCVGEHNLLHIAYPDAEGAWLRADLFFTLNPEGDFLSDIRMNGGFQKTRKACVGLKR